MMCPTDPGGLTYFLMVKYYNQVYRSISVFPGTYPALADLNRNSNYISVRRIKSKAFIQTAYKCFSRDCASSIGV